MGPLAGLGPWGALGPPPPALGAGSRHPRFQNGEGEATFPSVQRILGYRGGARRAERLRQGWGARGTLRLLLPSVV